MKPFYILSVIAILTSCNFNKKETTKTDKTENIVQSIPFLIDENSALPHLSSNNGDLIISWVTRLNDSLTALNYSALNKEKWNPKNTIITGKDWFVNWADYPSITANNGNLLSHFLKKSSKETFSYDINLNVLPKASSNWQTSLELHTDGTKTEHGFVTMLPLKEDSFFITWLDGRNTSTEHDAGHMSHNGSMTIRAAEVSNTGTISNAILLDEKTCSCCQTTAAITDNGPIVLYRDRTDEEIRDIAITRRVNGVWTKPKFIYNDDWKINGCPVNGPKVSAVKNNVAVAWFTAAQGTPKVKVVFSENGGAHFTEPIIISDLDVLGRVDIELIDNNQAIVSWMETEQETTYLKAMKVNKSGEKSEPILITKLNNSRQTGFPQMQRLNENMYFAWTTLLNETSFIKTAFVPITAF